MNNCFIEALMIGACLSFAACTKTESTGIMSGDVETEMSFEALSRKSAVITKGYVLGTGTEHFVDIKNPAATGATGDPRTIRLSAWNSTKEADYFLDKKFSKDNADNFWHATPKAYYPLGCEVDLLAYSAGDSITADWENAHKVKLAVQNTQDDILYSSAVASSISPTPTMTFHHSQAWIEFRITGSPDIKVDSIWWENIYGKGELRLEFDSANKLEPKADWEFFTQDRRDVAVDDPFHALSSPLDYTDTTKLNMLLPEQSHGSFVILYTMNGKQFPYRVKTTISDWERSKRYIYTLKFAVSGITLNPTVSVWLEETIDRMNSIDLIEGVFTVNTSGDKVLFSRGNLQYRASDSLWRFAEHQYDWIGWTFDSPNPIYVVADGSVNGSSNNRDVLESRRQEADRWIDLFGWGTSGNKVNASHTHFQPWTASTELTGYGPASAGTWGEDLDAKYDWGSNIRCYDYLGERSFRTLSLNEWKYLLNTREVEYHRYILGTLKFGYQEQESRFGLFLLPDNFIWKESFGPEPDAADFDNASQFSFMVDANVNGRWNALEYAGVVFLPAAGYRTGIEVSTYTPYVGHYWMSTSESTGAACTLQLATGYGLTGIGTSDSRFFGCSVRLVTNWK